MFVTKKTLYKELCKVMMVVHDLSALVPKIRRVHDNDIEDLKQRINYTMQKIIDLNERVEALESKKQPKKTKGK